MRNVEPWEDNMLKLTGNGRSASADMRLLFPDEPDDPDSKINRFVSDAFEFLGRDTGKRKRTLSSATSGRRKKLVSFRCIKTLKTS